MIQSIQQIRSLNLRVNEAIVIRPFVATDAAGILIVRGDSAVMRFVDAELLHTVKEAEDWINQQHSGNDFARWLIEFKGAVAGSIGISHINFKHHYASIGFEIGSEFQGKGIAKITLKAVSDYFLKTPLLHRIEAQCHVTNIASAKLMEACGYTLEATQKGNYLIDEEYEDSFLYSLVKN